MASRPEQEKQRLEQRRLARVKPKAVETPVPGHVGKSVKSAADRLMVGNFGSDVSKTQQQNVQAITARLQTLYKQQDAYTADKAPRKIVGSLFKKVAVEKNKTRETQIKELAKKIDAIHRAPTEVLNDQQKASELTAALEQVVKQITKEQGRNPLALKSRLKSFCEKALKSLDSKPKHEVSTKPKKK